MNNIIQKKVACTAWIAVTLAAVLPACADVPIDSPDGEARQVAETDWALSQTGMLHPVGAKLDSASTMSSNIGTTSQALTAALPTRVDLTAKLPPVGDQGSLGSCVGFAVGYATKTLQEATEMNWPPSATDHTFSPSWIYNQINGGKPGGTSVSTAMQLVVNKGTDSIQGFPYNQNDWLTQPDAASLARAAHYKAASWNSLTLSTANLKNVLAAGNAVVVAFNVLPDMDSMNGTTNTVYDTSAGTRVQRTYACNVNTASSCAADCNDVNTGKCGTCAAGVCTVPACTVAPCNRGGHAVAIVGYDDSVGAFRFINSWGALWDGNGYGWFSYNFITNASLGMQAFVLNDAKNVPGLPDSTMTWFMGSRNLLR
jgi:C1A family cysteine protease